MAVKLVAEKLELNALSTDDLADAPEGSTCHFIDTGEKYIFHNGAWEEDLTLIAALKRVL